MGTDVFCITNRILVTSYCAPYQLFYRLVASLDTTTLLKNGKLVIARLTPNKGNLLLGDIANQLQARVVKRFSFA